MLLGLWNGSALVCGSGIMPMSFARAVEIVRAIAADRDAGSYVAVDYVSSVPIMVCLGRPWPISLKTYDRDNGGVAGRGEAMLRAVVAEMPTGDPDGVAILASIAPNRCTGHCCRRFVLPFSLEKMREKLKTLHEASSLSDLQAAYIADLAQVIDMVIPLPEPTFDECRDLSAPGAEVSDPAGTAGLWFTCRNLDTDTGDCNVYETRPKMCRDYPYGAQCTFKGCTRPRDVRKEIADMQQAPDQFDPSLCERHGPKCRNCGRGLSHDEPCPS